MVPIETLLDLLPRNLLANLAAVFKVDAEHEIRLPGHVAFVCLLNGLLNHPFLTQRLLQEQYQRQTGRQIDYSTFSKWFVRMSPAYLNALFISLYERLAAHAAQGEANALRLRLVDATMVTLSAKLLKFGLLSHRNRGRKPLRRVKGVFELSEDGRPNLLRVCKDPGETSDCTALGKTMQENTQPGDLWVFDAGCHSRERLLNIHEAGGYWLTPHTRQTWQTLRVLAEYPLAEPLPAPKDGQPLFRLCRVEEVLFDKGPSARSAHLSATAADKQAFIRRLAQMRVVVLHGQRYDQRARTWKPLVLMSNLPLDAAGHRIGPFTFLQVAELYRRRWEIETFFKLIKQHLGYRHLPSRNENGITLMIYVTLIAALLLLWYKRTTGIDRGWKSVKFWLAEDMRQWAQYALADVQLLSG